MLQEIDDGLTINDLLSAGRLFPRDWDGQEKFGPVNEVIEPQEGKFTLHVGSTVQGGEDVMYFDSGSGVFGRATFVKEGFPIHQWKNIGQVMPGGPDGRLDQLRAAVTFVLGIDGILFGEGNHDEIMSKLQPHIEHTVRLAYELSGTHKDEIDTLTAQLPQCMNIDIAG